MTNNTENLETAATRTAADGSTLSLLATGGPTALIEFGGLRIVTDPTFDDPQKYVSPSGAHLTKTQPAARHAADLGAVDAVLLSHDHHPDNLDHSGRAFLADVPVTLTTGTGAARLTDQGGANAVPLPAWSTHELKRPAANGGGVLKVTSVPAQHGPEGSEAVSGEVVGFVLEGEGLPKVYVSGDNASVKVVEQVADRFGRIDIAILFAGAARVHNVLDNALLTLDSEMAAQAAGVLGARRAIVLHCNSWEHFTEGADRLRAAFAAAGSADLLDVPAPGESLTVTL